MIVTILRSCSAANSIRSGRRAIVPSSFMISQITPEGWQPASRARSTEPSVWPLRTSAPPCRARRGKMCPGETRSAGRTPGRMRVWTVWARSAALSPSVMPSAASTETVKAVPSGARLESVMGARRRRSTMSGSRATQMSPLPSRAMKATDSGVTASAAMIRSPSFSRSSSSTSMSIRPARTSSMASAMVARPGLPSASVTGGPWRSESRGWAGHRTHPWGWARGLQRACGRSVCWSWRSAPP